MKEERLVRLRAENEAKARKDTKEERDRKGGKGAKSGKFKALRSIQEPIRGFSSVNGQTRGIYKGTFPRNDLEREAQGRKASCGDWPFKHFSDHGKACGSHGSSHDVKGFRDFAEFIIEREPLAISWRGMKRTERTTEQTRVGDV